MTIFTKLKTINRDWWAYPSFWRGVGRRAFVSAIAATLFFAFADTTKAEWGEDVKLSTNETSAGLNENMGQCLIANGNTLHAVWMDTKGTDSAIHYRRSTDRGATWKDDVRLSPTPGSDTNPLIARSGKTLHLVFLRNGGTPKAASYYKRSTDDGVTWGSDVLLGTTKWWPGVAAAGSMVYVSLNTVYEDDAKNSVVYFRRSTDNGETWEERQQISTAPRRAGGRSEDPAIVADGKNVQLVWNDNRDSKPGKGMAVYFRRSSDMGKTWGAETALTREPDYTYFPSIHLAGSNVDIAYGDRQTGHYDIFYLHSPDLGETWREKAQMTKTPGDEFYAVIARDGLKMHMTWTAKEGVLYRFSGDGGKTWDPATTLTSKGGTPFIAVADDAVYMIFRSQRDGHPAIYFKCDPTGNKAKPGAKTP